MIKQLAGFVVCLGGIALMGGCFYAAYKSPANGAGWGIGGFLAGSMVINFGYNMVISK